MLEWGELLGVELRGDNLQQFENDWNATCLNVREFQNARFLEPFFRKQLETSEQLKNAMSLYWQDITQRGEEKSYTKLKDILRYHLERKLLDKSKNAWTRDGGRGAAANQNAAGDRVQNDGS